MALEIPLLGYFQRKNIYSAAHSGMRYHIKRIEILGTDDAGKETKEFLLQLIIWPEPWALERTDPILHEKSTFPVSEEGCAQIVKALTERYEQDKAKWDNCLSILESEPWYAPPKVEEENEEESK